MKTLLLSVFSIVFPAILFSQVPLRDWKFATGDDATRSNPAFDDAGWKTISPSKIWEEQGYEGYNGYAWYRIHFFLPSVIREKASLKEDVRISLCHIDDVDESFLNGTKIGGMGRFPTDPAGYSTEWRVLREYVIPVNHPALKWDADNVIAVRVYDDNGGGGLWGAEADLSVLSRIDYVKMDAATHPVSISEKGASKEITFKNNWRMSIEGALTTRIVRNGKTLLTRRNTVVIPPGGTAAAVIQFPKMDNVTAEYVFSEKQSRATLHAREEMPYILTPPESPKPRINTPPVYGCSPGAPFRFLIAASGKRPMTFDASGLPEGLSLDKKTGIITGKTDKAGEFKVVFTAQNAFGKVNKTLQLKVGTRICLTPPMGWNSWNCWGLSVSDARVRASADAMKKSGLINHGWTYMNIDDGWESPQRTPSGELLSNEKFPDMKALADYVHDLGLKIGIYSSPGERTCGGFLASWQHEGQDAATWAAWGIDYLKYDWCSYSAKAPEKPSLDDFRKPYIHMRSELNKTGRDIVYSLCQYGMGDVWKWGGDVGGNLWRTTGDIEDTWESLLNIGFAQETPASYNSPGFGWGDPDMLIVGLVGWGDHLHQTRLTPSEQYTHISLWALLSAPMLIGCDLARLDPFTYNLLANDEVNAIDQDALGKGATRVIHNDDLQVWVKELADGHRAIGVFNLKNEARRVRFAWKDAGLAVPKKVRDVWRQKNLPASGAAFSADLPAHGCALLKVW